MYPYISHTPDDEQKMLEAIGVSSIDELFEDIPDEVAFKREFKLDKAKSELEVRSYMTELSKKNCSLDDLTCFLGAGAYDHYIPSIVDPYNFQE
jgi:glycine dehydrogenase subunit 1